MHAIRQRTHACWFTKDQGRAMIVHAVSKDDPQVEGSCREDQAVRVPKREKGFPRPGGKQGRCTDHGRVRASPPPSAGEHGESTGTAALHQASGEMEPSSEILPQAVPAPEKPIRERNTVLNTDNAAYHDDMTHETVHELPPRPSANTALLRKLAVPIIVMTCGGEGMQPSLSAEGFRTSLRGPRGGARFENSRKRAATK